MILDGHCRYSNHENHNYHWSLRSYEASHFDMFALKEYFVLCDILKIVSIFEG